VLQIAVSGNTDERTLKEIARELRDEISAINGISLVNVSYVRPYEISIEISELELRRYGITLNQVSQAIRSSSFDMPGGTIKTNNGEILIRTTGQAYWGAEFEEVVVVTKKDGTRVTLGDIATIRDTFEEGDLVAEFNGVRGVVVNVSQVGKEDLMQIARDTKVVVDKFRANLPKEISLDIWIDTSEELKERMNVLLKNAGGGLILVLIILTLFLKFKIAMWVAIGIPVALLGTLAFLPLFDMTISTMTVMAFILVLGIVVDDAIVVGERIYGHEQLGKDPLKAAVEGTWEVSTPVIFGVLTTIAAFLPLVISEGRMTPFFAPIGYVVIIALACSIIESQLILPSHLAHRSRKEPSTILTKSWTKFQGKLAQGLENIASGGYKSFLLRTLKSRYIATSVGLGILILALSLIFSGRVVFGFFPSVEGDRIYATIELPEGIAVETTLVAAQQMVEAAERVNADMTNELQLNQPLIRNIFSSIGQQGDRQGPGRPAGPGQSNMAEVAIELAPLAERNNLSAKVVANRWREYTGSIPDAVKLAFDASMFSAGAPFEVELKGKDVDRLREAAEELKGELGRFDGMFDISDSFRSGKQEIQLSLLPEARNLGLTLNDLATQVRNAFYGAQAQRVQRGEDDVRVMVRFPEAERKSIGSLEDMYIRTPDGNQVPFYSVAKFEIKRGYSTINRIDGRRTVSVSADVDRGVVAPEEILASVQTRVFPSLTEKYPDVDILLGGEQMERFSSMNALLIGFVFSLIVIYGLLAIPLKSYLQPLVIMSVIPFGAVGAIVGHYVLDVQLMFFSALGIVALAGVVVNSSLVLVDYANRQRREGVEIFQAIVNACTLRFRPILLTSVTTFVGLIPLMTTVTPATGPFLPIAISLAWGVLFATFITLLLVPCLYLMVEDWLDFIASFKAWLFNDPTLKRAID
jgi:multidrug efflux pump subunit AcrB